MSMKTFFSSLRLRLMPHWGAIFLLVVILIMYLGASAVLAASGENQQGGSPAGDSAGQPQQSSAPRVSYLITLERGKLVCSSEVGESMLKSAFWPTMELDTSALFDEDGLSLEVSDGQFLQIHQDAKGEFNFVIYTITSIDKEDESLSVHYQGFDLDAAVGAMISQMPLEDQGGSLLLSDTFKWSIAPSSQTLGQVSVLRTIGLLADSATYSCTASYEGTARTVN